jgi:hypothetical protein
LGGRDLTALELRDLTRIFRVPFGCPTPRLHRHQLEGLYLGKAVKIFQISRQGDLSFGIISPFKGAIVIDQMSALQAVIKTTSWTILTSVVGIYSKPLVSEVSITGGKSITSTRGFTLTYTTAVVAAISTTETTTISWLILI